ncbi:hypothetical protein TVAG_247340 [Trichomonas vaginalis G3]|uniref:Right handed beta helix domain-containing protein n=1 Tax=Trichomonas vaginalis (strain ATCC PRA-98 / G3) TaxID=412133 RepID=A2DKS2_TRIV3|nr:pectin lyase-like family [Trichomonas vaginalis G3]EAY19055.1 hypothetical protein TVAG_247340 [Trichomonas vaginalis G3]KAI5521140.1 pectin lyase-like family [Trichomonas vaginalis G3]|eukprot:XP_001580041.1 hypothetical protein [Trichomonas vaginalis G3]
MMYMGNISFLQNNSTRNYCKVNTVATAFGEGTSSIKYSIIDENYANSRICISAGTQSKFDSIVFTNNTLSTPDGVPPSMICCSGSGDVTLENCFIANNKQNGQYLFGISYEGSITVSNSYIDTTELLYESGQNVKIGPNKEGSLELHFLSTELCPGGDYFVNFGKGNKVIFTELIHLQGFEESIASIVS